VLEQAPLAPRPPSRLLPSRCRFLDLRQRTQASVLPERWTLTVEQAIDILKYCATTSTWAALADVKGEGCITMRDVAAHFLRPWTQGTGCSVAVLLWGLLPDEYVEGRSTADNAPQPDAAQAFVCHAWDGPVVELRECLRSMAKDLSPRTRIWLDAFSLYLPDDGAPGGLMHSEQMSASSQALKELPPLGIFVVRSAEVNGLSRLWVLYELWLASRMGLRRTGLCTRAKWADAWSMWQASAIATTLTCHQWQACPCARWQDRAHILAEVHRMDAGLEAVASAAQDFCDECAFS